MSKKINDIFISLLFALTFCFIFITNCYALDERVPPEKWATADLYYDPARLTEALKCYPYPKSGDIAGDFAHGVGRCMREGEEAEIWSGNRFLQCRRNFNNILEFSWTSLYYDYEFAWIPSKYCVQYMTSLLSVRLALDITIAGLCFSPALLANSILTATQLALIVAEGYFNADTHILNIAFLGLGEIFQPELYAGLSTILWIAMAGPATSIVSCPIAIAAATAGLVAANYAYRGAMYEKAKKKVDKTALCGENWKTWGYLNEEFYDGDRPVKGSTIGSMKRLTTGCIEELANCSKKVYRCNGKLTNDYTECPKTCYRKEGGFTLYIGLYTEKECEKLKGEPRGNYVYEIVAELKKECDPGLDNYYESRGKVSCENMLINEPSLRNKLYREFLYDGTEYTYKGCKDPRLPEVKGVAAYEGQRYYYRGNEEPNYACERFKTYNGKGCILRDGTIYRKLPSDPNNEIKELECISQFKEAYECCQASYLDYVCLESNNNNTYDVNNLTPTFCKVDRNDSGINRICKTKDVDFHVYSITYENQTYGCARSIGLCPYDFNVRMGTLRVDKFCGDNNQSSEASCGNSDDWKKIKNGSGNGTNGMEDVNKNFCQHMAHCVPIPAKLINEASDAATGVNYMSPACINFIGDSQNAIPMELFGITKNMRGITAPMAQCLKESVENIFQNRVGNSTCRKAGLSLNNDGYCGQDTAEDIERYKKVSPNTLYERYRFVPELAKSPDEVEYYIIAGEKMPPEHNIFVRIQDSIRAIIKLVATMAIMVGGFKILKSGNFDFEDEGTLKDLTFKVFKFAIVMYFSVGDAWQGRFYQLFIDATQFVYATVYEIATPRDAKGIEDYIVLQKVSSSNIEVLNRLPNDCTDLNSGEVVHLNKCYNNNEVINSDYFRSKGNLNTLIEEKDKNPGALRIVGEVSSGKYYGCYFDPETYPDGKAYISVFDTLDCKLAMYFGLTGLAGKTNGAIATIILFAVSSLFTVMLGPVLFVASIFLFFIMLSVAIKALYVFVVSIIMLNILIFVSPIIFPSLLFERTKGIFEQWYGLVFGCAMQPVMIFVFIALFTMALDKVALGGARFTSEPGEVGPAGYSLICPVNEAEVKDAGKEFSYMCMFSFKGERLLIPALGIIGVNLKILNLGFYALYFLAVQPLVVIFTLCKLILLAFIFADLMKQAESISSKIFGGRSVEGGNFDAIEASKKTFHVAKETSYAANSLIKSGTRNTVKGAMGMGRKIVGLFKGNKGSGGGGSSGGSSSSGGNGGSGNNITLGVAQSSGGTPKIGKTDSATKKNNESDTAKTDSATKKNNESDTARTDSAVKK